MHCHDRYNRCHDHDRPYGSYGTPEFVIFDFSPITNITELIQIANAVSIGGPAAASNAILA